MAEIWNLLDENGNFTGIKYERGGLSRIPEGLYHLAVEVWVKSADGLLLITQRQKGRKRELLWEVTCGSAIYGEASVEAAQRELAEEIGIRVPLEDIKFMGRIKGADCYVDSYTVTLTQTSDNVKLTLQEEEVAGSRFVEIDSAFSLGLEFTDAFEAHYPVYLNKIKGR